MSEMVRKVSELKSLDELNLSKRVHNLLAKKFGTDMVSLVKFGRNCEFTGSTTLKYQEELVHALDAAGFIRHDIDKRTRGVWNLYYAAYGKKNTVVGNEVEQEIISSTDFGISDDYETMPSVTDMDFEVLKSVLETLTEREQRVLTLHFGLDGEGPRNYSEIGRIFDFTNERIKHIERKTLRKLRHPSRKRIMPTLFGFIPPKMPPKVEYGSAYDVEGPVTSGSGIEDLGLSVRAYHCLKRARINTIEDALKLPEENWYKVRNLGRRGLEEVIEKIRAIGYPDFFASLS